MSKLRKMQYGCDNKYSDERFVCSKTCMWKMSDDKCGKYVEIETKEFSHKAKED